MPKVQGYLWEPEENKHELLNELIKKHMKYLWI